MGASGDMILAHVADGGSGLGREDIAVTRRWIAQREFETVDLEVDGDTYEVTVKVASDAAGEVYDVSAEYDDAAAVAAQTDGPLRDVIQRAETAVGARLEDDAMSQ